MKQNQNRVRAKDKGAAHSKQAPKSAGDTSSKTTQAEVGEAEIRRYVARQERESNEAVVRNFFASSSTADSIEHALHTTARAEVDVITRFCMKLRRGKAMPGQSYIGIEIPAPMAAALDAAAREEFIRNAVREKIARENAVSGRNPLDKLENAKAQADALLFLLIEFINHNEDGLTLTGDTQAGLMHLRGSVMAGLAEAYRTAEQGIAELKGGAR